jgi:hypothetical protein
MGKLISLWRINPFSVYRKILFLVWLICSLTPFQRFDRAGANEPPRGKLSGIPKEKIPTPEQSKIGELTPKGIREPVLK